MVDGLPAHRMRRNHKFSRQVEVFIDQPAALVKDADPHDVIGV
jgi:hypothetical protein